MKDRNKRKLIIYALVGVLMLTTVAYASLQTILNVSGTVVKKGNLWNIYFTNPSSASIVGTATGSSLNIQASSLNFQVSLYKPSDKVTYTVDIKNGGTIDAVLNSISLTGLDTAKSNSLNYTVTYSNGSTIKEGDTLNAGSSKTIKITVEFDSSATSLPESDVNLTFGVTLIYGQTTSSSSTGTSGITSNNVIAGIYGESIQNGTPTPTSPVEIESVGEKTANLYNNGDVSFNATKLITLNTPLEAGTYTISLEFDNDNETYSKGLLFYSGETGAAIGNLSFSKGERSINTVTFDQKIYKLSFYATSKGSTNAGVNAIYKNIKIEKGSTATSYEPYGYKVPITVSNGSDTKTTNIYLKEPLRKMGDSADYLDLTNKKVVRNVKEYKITGKEQWALVWTNDTTTIYKSESLFTDAKPNSNKTTIGTKSNKLGAISYDGYSAGVASMWQIRKNDNYKYQVAINYYNNSCGSLFIKNIDYKSDVSNFKKWLSDQYDSGDPVLVDYILTTPTEESVNIPELPSLTGNVTYSIGTSIKPSSINYTTR